MNTPEQCAGYDTIRLPPSLDRNTITALRSRFRQLAASGQRCHVLDLDGSDPYQVETTAAVISILRSVREYGGGLRLVAAQAQMRHMLAITGLDKIMCVFASLRQAESPRDCHVAHCERRASNA
jgi:anti-anti-sigma factor